MVQANQVDPAVTSVTAELSALRQELTHVRAKAERLESWVAVAAKKTQHGDDPAIVVLERIFSQTIAVARAEHRRAREKAEDDAERRLAAARARADRLRVDAALVTNPGDVETVGNEPRDLRAPMPHEATVRNEIPSGLTAFSVPSVPAEVQGAVPASDPLVQPPAPAAPVGTWGSSVAPPVAAASVGGWGAPIGPPILPPDAPLGSSNPASIRGEDGFRQPNRPIGVEWRAEDEVQAGAGGKRSATTVLPVTPPLAVTPTLAMAGPAAVPAQQANARPGLFLLDVLLPLIAVAIVLMVVLSWIG